MSGGGAGCGLHFTLWVLGCQLVGEGLREREQTTSGRVSFHGRTIKEVEREGVGPPRSFLCLQVGRKSSEQDRSVFLDLERNRGPGGVTLRTKQFCLLPFPPPLPLQSAYVGGAVGTCSFHACKRSTIRWTIYPGTRKGLFGRIFECVFTQGCPFFFFGESCEISCI